MAFFPDIDEIKVSSGNRVIGRDFYFERGQHYLDERGNIKEYLSDVDILKEWIRKVILTQADAYKVYVQDEKEKFGVSIWEHLGSKDRGYFLSELKREITEQLTASTHIKEIKDYSAKAEGRKIIIRFTAVTEDNIEVADEIIINV